MPLSRAVCSECPLPVEGRALTCSDRCRKARSRRLSAARAASHLGRFEGLLGDEDVPQEVREAYAALVEDVPAFRATHARALAHATHPDEERSVDYSSEEAIRARAWLRDRVARSRPGARWATWSLFDECAREWRGSRVLTPIARDVFHEVARDLLDVEDGCYVNPTPAPPAT